MPPLKNARHELIAIRVAEGKSYSEAGRLAGLSPRSVGQTVHTIMKRPEVRARVAELQEAGARDVIMSIRERAELLTTIARTSVTDLWHITQDGIELKGGEVPPELAPSVQEIKFETWTGGRDKRASGSRLTIKLYDTIEAIKVLNTMSGISDDNNRLISLLEGIRAIGKANKQPLLDAPEGTDDTNNSRDVPFPH